MLVVDDEPDNLDLLYRTFRRDFNVLRAESGQQALDMLAAQGEVAVIISDQRMPEMKGTEFLSKTVPEFPDTVRIILTGFTDVEDLVDAINSGQVYRYITKPWDPDELKQVVEQAVQTYDVLKQRGEAIAQSQRQRLLVLAMAEIAQTAQDLDMALSAIARAIQAAVDGEGCAVCLLQDGTLGNQLGLAGEADTAVLKDTSLVTAAISTQTLQCMPEMGGTPGSPVQETDTVSNQHTYCVVPVLFRNDVIAIVSLQWKTAHPVSKATQELVKLAAKQAGLALACLQ